MTEMNISLDITQTRAGLYTVTDRIKGMFPHRRCFKCGKSFEVGDSVAVAFTDRGNKLFHDDCLVGDVPNG